MSNKDTEALAVYLEGRAEWEVCTMLRRSPDAIKETPEWQAASLLRKQAEEIERLKGEHEQDSKHLRELASGLGKAHTENATLTRQLQEAVEERDALLSVTVGAIPETTDYANGWNDCRQEYGARRKAARSKS